MTYDPHADELWAHARAHADDDEFGWDEDIPESGRDWRRAQGIFVVLPIGGAAGARIAALQQAHDPKLAAMGVPHVTLVGSSGVGPIVPGTRESELRRALEPIARATAPIHARFGVPTRFMQTSIVSLPLDDRGPLRSLFEAVRASGLRFGPVRFAFTPHATLSFFPTLDRARERRILAERVTEEAVLDRIELTLTQDPRPPRLLLSLPLEG